MDSHDKQALSKPKQLRGGILPRDLALGFAAVEEVEAMAEVLVIVGYQPSRNSAPF